MTPVYGFFRERKGAYLANTPFQRSMTFDPVNYPRTVEALGVTIRRSLPLRADEAIEQ